MKTLGRKLALAIGGYLLFDLLYDDRKGGTPIPKLPCASISSRLWWGDEEFPMWWNWAISSVRRLWYGKKTIACGCPGCKHEIPMWWSDPLCECCGAGEECCHGEEPGTT